MRKQDRLSRRDRLISKISSIGYMPRWAVLILDMLLCLCAFFVAYAVSKDVYYGHEVEINKTVDLVILLSMQFVWFWLFHTYSGILRYSTFVDVVRIIVAVMANMVSLYAVHIIARSADMLVFLPVGILFYGVFAFVFLFVVRLFIKTFYDAFVISSGKKVPVVVYGTKSAGVSIAKMLKSNSDSRFQLVGFVDDEQKHYDKRIFGRQIFSLQDMDGAIMSLKRKRVKAVVLSPFKMKHLDASVLTMLIDNGIKVLIVPAMEQWKEGDAIDDIDIERNMRNIQIEDLLNRKPIEIEKEHLRQQLSGEVVMVTGAAGSIGSEISRQVASYAPKLLVLVDNAETPMHNLRLELTEKFPALQFACYIADVRSQERMDFVFRNTRPAYVYHAAAYKHVPMMEEFPSECIKDNVMGTKNVADCAVRYGVRSFVMVSTDKAVNPTNVMGASKRVCEIYVQSLSKKLSASGDAAATKFITTRFGNVLGSNGSVIPLFKKQIENGGPVTVTHPDIIRYFMTIPEACQLVLEAGTMGKGGEIFIFDMGQPVRIADLAEKMIRLAGLHPGRDIEVRYTGLRPGEKLYEELLNVKETTKPTYHEKIMIANVREYVYDDVKEKIDSLISEAMANEDYNVVRIMKEIVPEYVSQNSKYEALDAEVKR